ALPILVVLRVLLKHLIIPQARQVALCDLTHYCHAHRNARESTACVDEIAGACFYGCRFTGNEAVVYKCFIIEQVAVCRDNLAVANSDCVALANFMNYHGPPVLTVGALNCQREIRLEVAIKSQALIRLALEPAAYKEKEHQAC